ncbi:hypothetical protein QC762_208340 [Podospora pseudocomata]|uniref:Uncharacterized protein n=1 Tax=Podospora pseudocomata TaxID=2093779 RepID=A0ABR0GML9_9PEZI|nr:hypothetical protein QC762_208340 [Podospora pseudocomata]
MTGVRAWARRGLAFDPTATTILDGHEKAWRALHLWAKKTTGATQSSTAASGEEVDITPAVQEQGPVKDGRDEVSKVTKLFHNVYRSFISPSARPDLPEGEQTLPHDRGVPRLQPGFGSSTRLSCLNNFIRPNIFLAQCTTKAFPASGFTEEIESEPTGNEAMSGYATISNLMPTANDIVPRATTFTNLAERILGYLATSNHVRWKGFVELYASVNYRFTGKPETLRGLLEAEVDNTLGYATTAHPDKWSFQQPNLVQGFIAIWLFTLARRRAAIRDVISNPWVKELMFRHEYIGPLREAIGPESELRYLRIIGTPGTQTDAVERWIGVTTTGIKTPNSGSITQHEAAEQRDLSPRLVKMIKYTVIGLPMRLDDTLNQKTMISSSNIAPY